MGMLKEFKEFAVKGNVVDMAVGLIIGAAFQKIVTSLVSQVIMPPIGMLLGKVDFSKMAIPLHTDPVDRAKDVAIQYGAFLNTVIDFVIVAFVIFLVIKQVNRFKQAPPPAEPNTKECPFCISSVSIKATRCPHCPSELTA
jgi:large conductance mechanosensitive channel